jgi:hypothetical protein
VPAGMRRFRGPAAVFDGMDSAVAAVVSIDLEERRLDLEVPEAEMTRRREGWTAARSGNEKDWGRLEAAADIMLKLIDKKIFLSDGGLHDVSDGDDADKFSVIEDRQMPDFFIRHKGHAVLYGF